MARAAETRIGLLVARIHLRSPTEMEGRATWLNDLEATEMELGTVQSVDELCDLAERWLVEVSRQGKTG